MIRIEVRYDPKKVDSITRARLLKELPAIVVSEFTGHIDAELRSRLTQMEMFEVSPENVGVAPLTARIFASSSQFMESVNATTRQAILRRLGELLPRSVGHAVIEIVFVNSMSEGIFL